jgi:exopolysaccharide biosynthesis polyprenyl glycosylphosphotransferase
MRRGSFVVISLFADALLVNASFILAFLVRFGGVLPQFNFEAYVRLAPVLTVFYLGSAYVFGLYEPERTESFWSVVRAVVQAVLMGALLTFAAAFIINLSSFSRAAIAISVPLTILFMVSWRLIVMWLFPISWPEQRIVVVGVGELAYELAAALEQRRRWGYRVVGLVAGAEGDVDACSAELAATGSCLDVLGSVSDLPAVIADHRVDRVMVASPIAMREVVERLALADEADVIVDVVPELYEIFIGTVDSVVSDIPLMRITHEHPGYVTTFKRILDLLGALLLLVVLSPLWLLAALIALLSMGWPVLFRQERTGKDMKPFPVFKFRTMVRDAEARSGPVLATVDDPRVTPFGRFMRKTRIDELPQLLNIVAGQMSFVGPRPERPVFVERFLREIPGYRERFKTKPGVTGLAQVSGGYATTPERKLKYDLIYMYHQNLLMDLQIIVETIRVVLTGRGAR